MKNFKDYEIQFVGLKLGKHHFDYHIDGAFFELFEYDQFNNADINAQLLLDKKSTLLELHIQVDGLVNVNCDVTNIPYDQHIEGDLNLVVKFGDAYNDEDEEILILPQGEYLLQVQQYIYEAIILAVPYKKVHPKVLDGTMDSEILDKLEELSPGNKKQNDAATDPRWDKLKGLLNEN